MTNLKKKRNSLCLSSHDSLVPVSLWESSSPCSLFAQAHPVVCPCRLTLQLVLAGSPCSLSLQAHPVACSCRLTLQLVLPLLLLIFLRAQDSQAVGKLLLLPLLLVTLDSCFLCIFLAPFVLMSQRLPTGQLPGF